MDRLEILDFAPYFSIQDGVVIDGVKFTGSNETIKKMYCAKGADLSQVIVKRAKAAYKFHKIELKNGRLEPFGVPVHMGHSWFMVAMRIEALKKGPPVFTLESTKTILANHWDKIQVVNWHIPSNTITVRINGKSVPIVSATTAESFRRSLEHEFTDECAICFEKSRDIHCLNCYVEICKDCCIKSNGCPFCTFKV